MISISTSHTAEKWLIICCLKLWIYFLAASKRKINFCDFFVCARFSCIKRRKMRNKKFPSIFWILPQLKFPSAFLVLSSFYLPLVSEKWHTREIPSDISQVNFRFCLFCFPKVISPPSSCVGLLDLRRFKTLLKNLLVVVVVSFRKWLHLKHCSRSLKTLRTRKSHLGHLIFIWTINFLIASSVVQKIFLKIVLNLAQIIRRLLVWLLV